jgi:hypothetical protein
LRELAGRLVDADERLATRMSLLPARAELEPLLDGERGEQAVVQVVRC